MPPGGRSAEPPGDRGAEPPGGFAPPPSRGFPPPVTGSGYTPPPPASAPPGDGPQDQSTPWEQRAQLGLFPALFATVKRSATDPVNFFGRMRVDNADGAISYYWLVAGVGAVAGQMWQAGFTALNFGRHRVSSDNPMAALMNGGPLLYVGLGLAVLLLAPVFLYIGAGILHLSAMVLRSAGNGFNATLRAVAYAAGPNLLAIIPLCGALIGGIWTLVLLVIAIWKLQRTSVGLAVAVVLLPMALLFCCACVAAIAIGAAAGGALSHFGGG